MATAKHLERLTALLLCLALMVCALIVYFAQTDNYEKAMDYETKLFGDDILAIDIQVDEAEWQQMLDNALAKEYIAADLVINGELFSTVGVRTKGNSSLTQVAGMSDSDRYSLHFKFNHYKKGQTCYGLDAFCVNNILGDTTYMKDYISYDIMRFIGVEAPLTNYAEVTVNGEDYGFFLAIERYEKSFLARAYDTSGGQLYNVKLQMGRQGDFEQHDLEMISFPGQQPTREGSTPEGGESGDGVPSAGWPGQGTEGVPPGGEASGGEAPSGREEVPMAEGSVSGGNEAKGDAPGEGKPNSGIPDEDSAQNRPGGMRPNQVGQPFDRDMPGANAPGGTKNGGDLVYVDDEISSYASIFENAEFKKNSDKDKERVITAIKNLNAGTDLEKYWDVDAILRYLAAHTVVVNLDSYSTGMTQNYYIYERGGRVTILPWDYGLAFGGFQSRSASDVVNFPVDTPVSGVEMESRPLINKLLEVPEYLEKYHQYLDEIVTGYLNGDVFTEIVSALDEKINDYVKNDTTAFTSYSDYQAALPVFVELCNLRAESIAGQLAGSIPATTQGQQTNASVLVAASHINLSTLGTMMGGGGMAGGPWQEGEIPQAPPGESGEREAGGRAESFGELPDRQALQEAIPMLQQSGGVVTDEIRDLLLGIGLSEAEIEALEKMFAQVGGGRPEGGAQQPPQMGGMRPGGQVGTGEFPGSRNTTGGSGGSQIWGVTDPGYVLTVVVLLLLLGSAIYILYRIPKRY